MSYNGSDDSEGEGFIPNKMIIKRRDTIHTKEQGCFQVFQPHYITGETVIKKQPPQCYASADNIQRQSFNIAVSLSSELNINLPSASQEYLSKDYELVYSRFKRPFGPSGKAAFMNEVIIKSITRNEHFRTLKNWKSDNLSINQPSEILKLDSKFQGGNLLCAFRSLLQTDTYILFMQNDTNTYGYNQWFYFSIKEAMLNKKYKFKIVNFKKNYSFFRKGMQPYIFSLEESKRKGCGWYMGGTNFEYYRSNFAEKQSGAFYTLSFEVEFKHAKDFVMISSSLPYSYSKLIQQISNYQKIAQENFLKFQLKSISKTLGGNQVPYLKVSKDSQFKKKIILITARQHSGQIWSSYLMDQILKGIVKQEDEYFRWIIQNFDFHIFPMINVDGVIYGNFRCDLAGYDLNRCWKDPSSILQPHVYQIRQKMQQLAENSTVQLYLDLHTHSKQHGVFAYSCVESSDCRKFPQLISVLSPLFRYPACTFGVSAEKRATARSEVFQLTNCINTITVQLSAFGYRHPKTKILEPFSLNNIKAIAQALINATCIQENKNFPIKEVNSYLTVSPFSGIKEYSDDNEAVSGSDSEPEIDTIQYQIKAKNVLKQLKAVDSKLKKNRTKMKKIKTNLNLTNSLEASDIQSVHNSPKNRNRAITQTQQKRAYDINTESKKILSSTFVPQRTATSFKKIFNASKLGTPKLTGPSSRLDNSYEISKSTKPLNLIEFSLKKLPIEINDKSTRIFPMFHEMSNKNQIPSLSFAKRVPQPERPDKNKTVTFYRSKKEENPSPSTNHNTAKEPYQFLCIMSESKKRQQIQRIKQRRQQKQLIQGKINSKVKFGIIKQNTVLQRYTRDKKVDNSDNFSRVWLKNVNRYSKSLEDPLDYTKL